MSDVNIPGEGAPLTPLDPTVAAAAWSEAWVGTTRLTPDELGGLIVGAMELPPEPRISRATRLAVIGVAVDALLAYRTPTADELADLPADEAQRRIVTGARLAAFGKHLIAHNVSPSTEQQSPPPTWPPAPRQLEGGV
jgi:hypothetical protein